jgi:hypothetical protein
VIPSRIASTDVRASITAARIWETTDRGSARAESTAARIASRSRSNTRGQLFFDVFAKNGENAWEILLDLHFGQLGRRFPCAEIGSTRVNRLPHFSQ